MFETAGTLTIVELVSSLVALVLLPLLWAAVATIAAIRGSGARFAVRVAIATSGGAFGLAIAHAVRAAQTSAGRVAEQHVVQLSRIGQLDLGIDLVRDPTSAAFAVLATFIGFASVLHVVWTRSTRVASRLAWTGLATSATLLVVLADDLPAVAVGLQLATVAAWALGGGGRAKSLGLALAGDWAVVFGAWVLFWSLGGSFGASGFTPDPLPRFAIVTVPTADEKEAIPKDAKATVTVTTYEDSLVTSDDGPPLPGEPLRAPFTLTLDPGNYSFRIQAGAATTDLLVTHVTLAPGRAYVLTPYGPTTSIRNLGDQLAVPRPTPTGPISMRAVLDSRSIAGIHVSTMVGIITMLAVLLRLALLGKSERGGLGYALESVPPIVLALHVAPLVDPAVAAAIAVVPAFAAMVLAATAAASRTRDGVPRAALAALVSLAIAAVFLGETAGAVMILVPATLGCAAVSAALDASADVRWLGVACACVAGVLPFLGCSPGLASVVAGAFGASARGFVAGGIVAPLATVAVILASLAVFRVYGATISVPRNAETPRGPRVLVAVLAVGAVLGGAALGDGTSPFGGRIAPLARRLVAGPGGIDGVSRIAIAALVLSIAAAVIGLIAARRATRTPDAPAWIKWLDAPALLVAHVARWGSGLLGFFVRSVVVMDEDVIDDATEVLASGVSALGSGVGRLDAAVAGGRLARALGRGADEVVVRTGMDDPQRFERVKLGLVIGMVVVLGAVVLSSMVLG
jgi:hypothetical protein